MQTTNEDLYCRQSWEAVEPGMRLWSFLCATWNSTDIELNSYNKISTIGSDLLFQELSPSWQHGKIKNHWVPKLTLVLTSRHNWPDPSSSCHNPNPALSSWVCFCQWNSWGSQAVSTSSHPSQSCRTLCSCPGRC